MNKRPPTNVPASIRDRLLQIAKERGEEFQNLLINYALERWLYRLSQSSHRDRFVLKGAMLFALWTKLPHRATQDLDLLGYGDNSIAEMERVFREICDVVCVADGLELPTESVVGGLIREDRKYEGVRINLLAKLGKARIPLQIDIGFGDVVIPPPTESEYPTLLDLPAPRLRVYRRETVIAEKFQAMVERGIGNSRMKDYFDLWVLAGSFEFEESVLGEAIRAVFERRQTQLPTITPIGLSEAFANHPEKLAQWRAFVRRSKLKAGEVSLPEVVARVRVFLLPVMETLAASGALKGSWKPKQGRWK